MIPKVLYRFSLSIISISLITACSKPITRLTGNGVAGTNYSSPSTNDDDARGSIATGPSTTPIEAINQATLIQLANSKFAGEEADLEAIVSLGGITTARLKLTSAAGLASIIVPTLPTEKSDTLIVQIYEGTKLRFIGKRIATVIASGKANTVTLADCIISKVPWDGSSNEGTCGWSVQDSK